MDSLVQKKRWIRSRYKELLDGVQGISFFPEPADCKSSCWFSGIVIEDADHEKIRTICSSLRESDIETGKFDEVLGSYKPQFGRNELFHIGNAKVLLNLAKNPAGFNQNIAAVLEDESPKDLIIVINDNAQDGKDISWLWDVDFDSLSDESIRSITVSGIRGLDMQLRLKYVGIESSVTENTQAAIRKKLDEGSTNLYVLVNYTALYDAHKLLQEMEKKNGH